MNGQKLREFLGANGISRAMLMEFLGVTSRQTISNWLNDRPSMPADKVAKLATYKAPTIVAGRVECVNPPAPLVPAAPLTTPDPAVVKRNEAKYDAFRAEHGLPPIDRGKRNSP